MAAWGEEPRAHLTVVLQPEEEPSGIDWWVVGAAVYVVAFWIAVAVLLVRTFA